MGYPLHRCQTVEEFLRGAENGNRSIDSQERNIELRKVFLDAIMEPGYHACRSFEEKADIVGVSAPSVKKWEQLVPEEVWEKALENRRKNVAKDCLEVDEALKSDAKEKGADAKTRELFYRIFMGYTPQQAFELSRGKDKALEGLSAVDLLKEAIRGLPEEDRRKLLEEAGGGGVVETTQGEAPKPVSGDSVGGEARG